MDLSTRDKKYIPLNSTEMNWGEWMCEVNERVREHARSSGVNDLCNPYRASSSKADQKQSTPSRKQWGQTSNYKKAGEETGQWNQRELGNWSKVTEQTSENEDRWAV